MHLKQEIRHFLLKLMYLNTSHAVAVNITSSRSITNGSNNTLLIKDNSKFLCNCMMQQLHRLCLLHHQLLHQQFQQQEHSVSGTSVNDYNLVSTSVYNKYFIVICPGSCGSCNKFVCSTNTRFKLGFCSDKNCRMPEAAFRRPSFSILTTASLPP